MKIKIYAKTADCFNLRTEDGREYEGYPPRFLGDGDGIELTIDVETGLIKGWDRNKVKAWIETTLDTIL